MGKAATSLDFGGERFGKIQVCRRDAGASARGHTESPSTDDVCRPPRTPQDLQSTVRLKAHPQRSLGTFRLRIADDLVIAVAMYAALQPATKQKVRGSARDGQRLFSHVESPVSEEKPEAAASCSSHCSRNGSMR